MILFTGLVIEFNWLHLFTLGLIELQKFKLNLNINLKLNRTLLPSIIHYFNNRWKFPTIGVAEGNKTFDIHKVYTHIAQCTQLGTGARFYVKKNPLIKHNTNRKPFRSLSGFTIPTCHLNGLLNDLILYWYDLNRLK